MKLLPLKVSQAETAVTKTANDNDKGVHHLKVCIAKLLTEAWSLIAERKNSD